MIFYVRFNFLNKVISRKMLQELLVAIVEKDEILTHLQNLLISQKYYLHEKHELPKP